MASRLARFAVIAAIAAGVALGAARPSWADAAQERIVPPPRAFVDFCFREPQECPALPVSAARTADDSDRAPLAAYWRLVFEAGGPEALSTLTTSPQAGWAAPAQGRAELTRIAEVNRAVNRSLAERSDQSVYGRPDFWALPLANGGEAGDCEDFVLEKRRALRALGYTERQMSIAIVRTPWGQNHAVLLVSTEDGEVVLDNLSPRLDPWSSSSYTLLARQSMSDPAVWISRR